MNKLLFIIFHFFIAKKYNAWFGVIFLISFINTTSAEMSSPSSNEQGEIFFQQGDFESAITQWSRLAQKYEKDNDINTTQHIATLIKLGNAYQALGQYPASLEMFNRANKLIILTNNPEQKIPVMNSLGATYLAMGNFQKANELLQHSVDSARESNQTNLLVASLNNLGNLKVKQGAIKQALKAYTESIELSKVSGNKQLAAKSSVNAVLAAFEKESKETVGERLEIAKKHVEKTEENHNKAYNLISLGQIAQQFAEKYTDQFRWQSFAYHTFKQAERIGEKISDARAISYAKGYLGDLYSKEGRYDEALQLTRQAIFSIENSQAPEMLYQWQWQIGRILKSKGDNEPAIPAYQQAVSTLSSVRQDLTSQQSHFRSFREEIGPIYLELADLLLQANDTLQKGDKSQQNLLQARNVIEQLKAAELQDYFKDDCVSALQQKVKALESIDHQTAVVYPILLNDRLEILLSVPDGLMRFTISVNREDMINEVRLFRQALENRTTREYLPHAQKLYQWLIAPLQTILKEQKINTLVMVPDEFLRTIPMAALHDGEKFVIEKYAIANTPGLNITDSKPITAENSQLLAIGLAKSVQGFSALPHVATELENIHKIFGGRVLQDNDFLLNSVQNELKETTYNIVHIASHGQFKSDAKESFVLTFDDKLNMDGIEQLKFPSF